MGWKAKFKFLLYIVNTFSSQNKFKVKGLKIIKEAKSNYCIRFINHLGHNKIIKKRNKK